VEQGLLGERRKWWQRYSTKQILSMGSRMRLSLPKEGEKGSATWIRERSPVRRVTEYCNKSSVFIA